VAPPSHEIPAEIFALTHPHEITDDSDRSLPTVDDFLADDELPPVEHFLDPLPAEGELGFAEEVLVDANREMEQYADEVVAVYASADASGPNPDDTTWADTDWQQFDWRAAAALGEGTDPDAATAWSTTDWDGKKVQARENRESSAQAIANALDQIAARIRQGQLPVLPADLVTDPAAIAAALAALLGVRR
jgi:hypothetical protein